MLNYKCKFKDLVDDLIEMNVTEITIDNTGVLLGVVDLLRQKGVKVNTIK